MSGDGGNRTRVQRCRIRASPCAVRCDFLGPGDHANKSPTGPATVWFPTEPRDRARWFSPLDYARIRVGNTPGLTPIKSYTHYLIRQRGRRTGNRSWYWRLFFATYGLRDHCRFLDTLPLLRQPLSKPIIPMLIFSIPPKPKLVPAVRHRCIVREQRTAMPLYSSGYACRCLRFAAAIARSVSRRSWCSRRVWRLSYSFLPRASAISAFARPSLKYRARGTIV